MKRETVSDIQGKVLQLLAAELSDVEPNEQISYVFYKPFSIRLTYQGNLLLCKKATSHAVDLGAELKAGHLINISKTLTMPYYLSSKKLVLYEYTPETAMLLLTDDPLEYFKRGR